MGRRRPTPDVKSSNFMVREGAYRAAINMPIQGGAADLTKMAMSAVDEYLAGLRKAKSDDAKYPAQIMQVHESVMVECAESEAEAISKQMVKIMENIKPALGVKLKVDVEYAKNWGEL